jgi:CRP-like cAMP-binding protein
MVNPLSEKISSFADLNAEEREALDALCRVPFKRSANRHLIREGERPENVFLLLEGWAYRYKDFTDGSRQIVAYLLPGDLCDPHVFILREMDHSIALLSDATIVSIPKEAILRITDQYPVIARGFWWSALVDEAVAREWLVNLGRREAYERIAHLFCELYMRLYQVGLAPDAAFTLPLTQEQLGETMGLTSVHVNRVLQRMRADGLIMLRNKKLFIPDIARLKDVAGFDPNYLHLTRRQSMPALHP